MKKTISNFRFAAIALVFFFTTGVANAASGNPKSTEPVSIQYVGLWQSYPVFQLELNSTDSEELFVVVKDRDNNVLHSETLTGKNINRKYALEVERQDLQRIQISVSSKNNNTTQVYQLSNSTSVVEQFRVAKM